MESIESKEKRNWPRRLLFLVAAVVLLFALLFAAMQTPPAKRFMAARITEALSDALPWPVEIRGIGGLLPFVATVDSVRLGEAGDPWLELHGAAMNLNLLPLVRGQVSIERIGARTLALHRLPARDDTEDPEPDSDASFALPVLEDLPAWIRLGQLQVDRVALGEPVLGRALAFDVGGAYLPRETEAVRLNIRGLDDTEGTVSLTGGLRDGKADLLLEARDATVVPLLAGVEGPFALRLSIDGPLSNAAVALDVQRADAPLAALDLTVGYPEPLTVAGTGTVSLPDDLTPPAVLEKLGREFALDLDLALTDMETLSIQAARIDFEYGDLDARGTYNIATGDLDLTPSIRYDDFHRLTGQEPEGDTVAMAARIPVRGTRDELVIEPAMEVGEEPFLAGAVTVGLAEAISAAGDITLYPAVATTPPAFRDLLADGADITLDVAYAGGRVDFNETRIQVGATHLTVGGTANLEDQVLDLRAEAVAGDLHQFEGLAGIPLAGAARLDLTATGDATETTVNAGIQVENVTVNTLKAPAGNLDVDLVAGGFPDTLTDRIEATLSGEFPGFEPQPDLARDLHLAGSVTVEELQRVAVSGLDISDGNLAILAGGTINLDTRDADFEGTIEAAQIGDYAAIANLPWRGAVNLDATVASGEAPGSIVASVDGALRELGGLPVPADGLLGRTAKLSARGRYDRERASLTAFSLTADGLRASGQGDYDLDTETLNARLEGDIADLAALSGVAGRPLAGAAAFTLEASGPLDGIDARGTVTGRQLDLDVLVAESAEITFTASGIPDAIDAETQATLEQEGETLALNARIGLRDGTATLHDLLLAAGENRIAGQGTFNTARMRGGGELLVDAPDLAVLKTWLRMPLGGSLSLDATLAEDTGALSGQLDAADVVAGTLTLKSAGGTFNVEDVFGTPAGTVELTAAELDAGDIHLASLTFTAEGPPDGMRLNLKTGGVFQEFTRFNVDGGGLFSNEALAFDLRDLDFGVEGFTFALREPSQLSWEEGIASVTPLVLESESGTIQAAGEYAPDRVDVRLEWTDVSLRLIELAGIDPVDGAVSGTVTLTGTPEAPELRAETSVAGYRPVPDDESIPGLDARIAATIAGGALSAELTASVEGAAEFQGNAGFPVAFALAPWDFTIPEGAALTGGLTGQADLAAISPLLPMEGHELRGTLDADLAARGAVDAPRLDGAVTVADGYYEYGGTSTILNDLALRLEADGDTLRLAELSANDTAGGTYRGEGQIAFRPDEHSPFDFKLVLDKPRLVYRDDMRAEGRGELTFTGDSRGAELAGDLRVSPAYFVIPESSEETQVTTVDYTVAGAAREEGDAEKPPAYEVGLDLTIDLPGRVFVAGTGLDSEWQGKLQVKNNTAAPEITGTLRVTKGTLDFLGRQFSLAESTITFDGNSPPDPYLRIAAVTETQDVLARVRMEGVANALTITLESEPDLPRDEILARVLFGQHLSDVSPVQAITLARYAPVFKRNQSTRSILGRQGPQPFLVDRVSLRSGAGPGDASIATGKYLSDNFYLEFEQGLGAAQSLISLEWLFAPRWSLKGKTTSQGQGALGVFWKKDY